MLSILYIARPKYSHKHDLTKTNEFKKWKKGIQKQQTSDQAIETAPTTETITKNQRHKEQETSEEDRLTETDVENEPTETPEAAAELTPESTPEPTAELTPESTAEPAAELTEESTTVQNIISMAAEDLIPVSPYNPDNFENIISDIINELQQDDNLHQILNEDYVHPRYEDDDEGIELNVEVELEGIIEPLDLEAEGFFF